MADMDFLQFLNAIQQQYPTLIPILSQPGVLDVVAQAVKENWPSYRLEAALQATPYYKDTPIEKRQWDVLNATDPATAKEKATLVLHQIHDLEATTGIRFNDPNMEFGFLVDAVQNGWDANQIKYNMIASVNTYGGGGGEVGNNAAQVKSWADDYAVPLSDLAVFGWSRQLTQNATTPEAVKGYLIEAAKSRFPGLAPALDRGITVRQYADPYLQVLQQETGANVGAMSMTDPKIMAALDQVDPKTGAHYSLSMTDWTKKVRTDSTYGWDMGANAHAQAATLATQVAQKMGAV